MRTAEALRSGFKLRPWHVDGSRALGSAGDRRRPESGCARGPDGGLYLFTPPRLVAWGNYSRIGVAPVVSTLAQTNIAWSATVRRSCKLRVMDDLYPNSSAKAAKERTFAFNLHVRTEWQQVFNKNGYPTRDSNSL